MPSPSFLDRFHSAVKKENGGKVLDAGLTALVIAKSDDVATGAKILAVLYGKPAARAALRAVIEAALE